MPLYAHIRNGVIWRQMKLSEAEAAAIPPHKAGYIVPLVAVDAPKHERSTHHPPVETQSIQVEAPANVVDGKITQAWAAPVAKTAQEIEAEKNAEADGWIDQVQTKLIVKLLVATFRQENEIRALKGQSAITADTFIDGLAGLPDPTQAKLRDLLRAVGRL